MSMLASSDAPRFDELRLTRLRRVNAIAPSPCGTWLAVAVSRLDKDESKYVSDLWRVSLTDPAEPPRQLSRGDCNDTCPRFRSDGSLAFLSDRNPRNAEPLPGDSNRNQVWLLPTDMGEPVPLTDEPLGVIDFRFASATGDLFLITNVFLGIPHDRQRTHADDLTKRGPSGMHYTTLPVRHWNYWIPTAAPHLISYAGGERRDLTPVADREHREIDFGVEWNVAPDGSRAAIAVTRRGPRRIGDTALRLIDTATGQSVDLGTVDDTTHSEPCFAPDSAALACVRSVRASRKADRRVLWLFDQEDMQRGGQGRAVAADWNTWPTLHCFDDSSSALIATADVDGTAPVFRVDITTGEATRLSADSAGGCHTGLMLTGGAIVGLRHRLLHPSEPFILPMTADGEPTLLATLSGFTEADGAALATWESFTVVSDDGAKVQSFLLQPRTPGPHPALLWIHGGPLSQYADGWHWRWNPLVAVSSGYAVALPNPRGSTGGGHELIQGIWNNEWGGACYRDLMTVVASIAARPEIDGDRIAAMGGSFGGYMANWIGVSTDRFRCLVTHAGIYSLSAFTGTTDYPPYMHHEMSTNPYEDPEGFDRYSPHRRLERWKSPTLVIHGEKDYRVPIGEALHLFEALDWRGVDVELLIFPDEGHWILRPQNVRLWYRTVLEFLDKHMSRD